MKDKVLIIGGPRTGKTTFANQLGEKMGWPVFHTDDAMHLGWSECSEEVSNWIANKNGPWIIEGVAAVRALRKALEKKIDLDYEIVFINGPKVPLTKGQETMTKGVFTVLTEIAPRIIHRVLENPDLSKFET